MKKTNPLYNKFEKLVEQTLTGLLDSIIIKINGKYVLYNRYSIQRVNDYVVVSRRQDRQAFEFSQMKHAIIWSILDYHKRFAEAAHVKRLDVELTSVKIDKKIHAKLKINKDYVIHSIYANKLQVDIYKQKRIVNEIDKYYFLAENLFRSRKS